LRLSGNNALRYINLQNAKLDYLDLNLTAFSIDEVRVNGNNLPATDPVNGGLSEIIVAVNNEGMYYQGLAYI